MSILITLIIPIVCIIWFSINESKKSNVISFLSTELIAFISGWIASVALASIGFRFADSIELGLGNIFYFFFIVLPTVVFYPGVYYFARTYNKNKIIIVTASAFITPVFVVGLWWAVLYFG